MNKEKRSKYILYALLAVILLGCAAFVLRPQKSNLTATIQVGNKIIKKIPLDLAADGTFTIEDETGIPITFEVKEHAIRFAQSDCPDKVCVRAGYLSRDMDIASCLPNQTILTVESND